MLLALHRTIVLQKMGGEKGICANYQAHMSGLPGNFASRPGKWNDLFPRAFVNQQGAFIGKCACWNDDDLGAQFQSLAQGSGEHLGVEGCVGMGFDAHRQVVAVFVAGNDNLEAGDGERIQRTSNLAWAHEHAAYFDGFTDAPQKAH